MHFFYFLFSTTVWHICIHNFIRMENHLFRKNIIKKNATTIKKKTITKKKKEKCEQVIQKKITIAC